MLYVFWQARMNGACLHALQTAPNYDPCKAKSNGKRMVTRDDVDWLYTWWSFHRSFQRMSWNWYSIHLLVFIIFDGMGTIRTKVIHPSFLSCSIRLTCDTTKLQTLLRTEVIQSPQRQNDCLGGRNFSCKAKRLWASNKSHCQRSGWIT